MRMLDGMMHTAACLMPHGAHPLLHGALLVMHGTLPMLHGASFMLHGSMFAPGAAGAVCCHIAFAATSRTCTLR